MTDPISDMLTRIRNAIMARKQELIFPYSKIKFAIGKILEKEKRIDKITVVESDKISYQRKNKLDNRFKLIKIILKYDKKGQPAITGLKRISKPGQRIYVKKDKIPKVLNGFGLAIISTPRGLMTDQEARKNKIGGEIICEIY